MVGEVIDPFAEDRDLDFGRSGVLVIQTVGLDDARLGSCSPSMYLLHSLALVPLASRTPALGQPRVHPEPADPHPTSRPGRATNLPASCRPCTTHPVARSARS